MRDLKNMIEFEDLLLEANNDLVRQAKEEGKLALGYTCYFMPEALLNLPGCFSVRLRAPRSASPDMATYYMSGRTCMYGRALMERALEGGFNFLDAELATETCTVTCRFQEHMQMMPDLIKNPNFFCEFTDVPFKKTDNSITHYKDQLQGHVLDVLHKNLGVDISDEALLKAIEKANLKMAIVYEDATLDGLDDSGKQAQARSDMQYLNSVYFKSDCYVKVDGKPLLMCFGPQSLITPKGWNFAFATLATKPQFVVLNGCSNRTNDNSYTNSQGEFLWVNPTPNYNDAKNFSMYIAGAMPGFHDHYKESGQGNGYTTYDREDGNLFQRQLDAAKRSGLEWLQISTWNDYGEGTIIEPTKEFKYQYLEILQKFAGVSYTSTQLDIIYRWYKVAKAKGSENSNVRKAYDYLNSLKPDKAEEIIKQLEL